MGWRQLGLPATAAVLVLAATACEPAPTPWDVELVSVNAAGTGPERRVRLCGVVGRRVGGGVLQHVQRSGCG